MLKKSISLILFCMIILTGCVSNSSMNNNTSISTATKKNSYVKDKLIPFKYAFTGFVFVDEIYNGLPTGTKIFNTQKEWADFVSKFLPYNDIPLPSYSGGIDFTKDSLIYYSIVDAKVEFYAKAWQIDKITVKNQQLDVATKDLDGKLTITANNSERKGGNRYVILATVEKHYLMNIK